MTLNVVPVTVIPLPSVSSSGDAAARSYYQAAYWLISSEASHSHRTVRDRCRVPYRRYRARVASVVTVAALPLVLFVSVPPFAVNAAMMSPPAADVFAIVGFG